MPSAHVEARARVRAESRFIRRHDDVYRELAERAGHVEAVKELVKRHKSEYDRLVKEAVVEVATGKEAA